MRRVVSVLLEEGEAFVMTNVLSSRTVSLLHCFMVHSKAKEQEKAEGTAYAEKLYVWWNENYSMVIKATKD